MKRISYPRIAALGILLLLGAADADADQAANPPHQNRTGQLEIECNMAGVKLVLCPRSQFRRKTTSSWFGILKKTGKEICLQGELLLGTTPLAPVSVPPGSYMLLVPSGYEREQKQAPEISIKPGEKTFLMLKLFRRHGILIEGGPGGEGAGAGGGHGSGGGVGSGAP